MSLFTDGTISTLDDLAAQDTAVLDVASSEGIDLARKLEVARDEIGVELDAMLSQATEWGAKGPDHRAVIVTTPLRIWHTLYTLELVYRDAFNSQLNERYRGKRDQYHTLAKQAAERLMQCGVGLAGSPLPQPGQPATTPTGGTLSEGLYSVATSWVNSAGEESCISPVAVAVSEAGRGFAVQPGPAPSNATGWNVFAGLSAETLEQQNVAPLALDEIWLQSTVPDGSGRRPGAGQEPTWLRPLPRILRRG